MNPTPATPPRRAEELLKRLCAIDSPKPLVDLEDSRLMARLMGMFHGIGVWIGVWIGVRMESECGPGSAELADVHTSPTLSGNAEGAAVDAAVPIADRRQAASMPVRYGFYPPTLTGVRFPLTTPVRVHTSNTLSDVHNRCRLMPLFCRSVAAANAFPQTVKTVSE